MAGRAGAEVTEAPGSHAIYVSSPEIYWLPLVGAASDLNSDSFIEIASFNNGRHNGLVSAPAQSQSPTTQWRHDGPLIFPETGFGNAPNPQKRSDAA